MRAVIQRVQHAGVRIVGCDTVAAYEKKRGDEAKAVEKEKKREIGQGFLILLGVCDLRCMPVIKKGTDPVGLRPAVMNIPFRSMRRFVKRWRNNWINQLALGNSVRI